MTIITEASAPADPVEAAVAALVEAASASEAAYSLEDLQDLVEDRVLSEAGGLMGLLRRLYVGHDSKLAAAIEKEIPSIKTPARKAQVLSYIQKMIARVEKVKKHGIIGDTLNPFQNPGGTLGILARHEARKSGDYDKTIEALKAVAAKVEAHQV